MKEIILNEDTLKIVLEQHASLCYKCNLCGKIIMPIVLIKNNEITFNIYSNQLNGGFSVKILQDNICSNCVESYNRI